jgi:hypothetical protein
VVACFAGGTRIATDAGEVAVEALRPGMRVRRANGGCAPVVWIGHRRIVCRHHPNPHEVWPVRVAAGAFGAGVPARSLRLSPDHAVFVAGVLIPIRYLVNGSTIAQEENDAVTYWHVECDHHAVILAEGLACESYLDTGNRAAFANGGKVAMLRPDFAWRVWEARGCAELVLSGPRLAAARRGVLARAQALGHRLTRDPALAVVADGRALPAEIDASTWRVHLPATARRIGLVSRTWVPGETRPDEDDARVLGVALSGLRLDDRAIALDDPRLSSGWHTPEADWRWTNGDAGLALAGVRTLEFSVALTGSYWVKPAASAVKIG